MPPGDFSVLDPKHSRYTKAGARSALGDSPLRKSEPSTPRPLQSTRAIVIYNANQAEVDAFVGLHPYLKLWLKIVGLNPSSIARKYVSDPRQSNQSASACLSLSCAHCLTALKSHWSKCSGSVSSSRYAMCPIKNGGSLATVISFLGHLIFLLIKPYQHPSCSLADNLAPLKGGHAIILLHDTDTYRSF